MDHGERLIALFHGLYDHPNGYQVVDLVYLDSVSPHLLIDAVDVLGSTGNLGRHSGVLELFLTDVHDRLDARFPLRAARIEEPRKELVAVWREMTERPVFELPFPLKYPQTPRQRRKEIQSLLTEALTLGFRKRIGGLDVVETVGQLDQDNPDVPRHRHEHLAQRAELRVFQIRQVELGELGDAIDQVGDLGPELAGNGLDVAGRVLDDVVKQGRAKGGLVHMDVGQQRRDGERMVDERPARKPFLAVVALPGELIRFADHFQGGGTPWARDVFAGALKNLVDGNRARVDESDLLDFAKRYCQSRRFPGRTDG